MFALLALAPATADKPVCDEGSTHPSCKSDDTKPPRPPTFEKCVFINGVLQNWEPPASYRCQWTVEDLSRSFDFKLQPVMPDGEPVPDDETDRMTVNLPHLIVTDVYPYGGQICFNEYINGWNDLSFSWTAVTLPSNGLCTDGSGTTVDDEPNVFAITIDVIKVKNAEVQLQYTP